MMRRRLAAARVAVIACVLVMGAPYGAPRAAHARQVVAAPSVDFSHGALRVSDNHRFLVHADATPFFYLGDTAWELFHRLTREEAERYLENRRAKGFTVIQAVALAEFDGLHTPNAYGERPLVDDDPARPNPKYFEHVDWVVRKAAEKGLYVGLLPTWGDKVFREKWGIGPEVFRTPETARTYGRFIGARYRDAPNIIWILGGDRRGDTYLPIWRALAEGVAQGDGGAHLMTYHPGGGTSSSAWFHDDAWLDFDMLQSGHAARDIPNYEMVAADYARTPVKPVIDGELRYENHPINWNPEQGWFDDVDVRQGVYWSLFAGAAGVTYGCHDVWQFMQPGREPVSHARGVWTTSLDLPGARQMQYVRALLTSRVGNRGRERFLNSSRPQFPTPDQALIEGGPGSGADHVQATRGDGYLFVYIPTGRPVSVRVGALGAADLTAWWFNPRTGEATKLERLVRQDVRRFVPPGTPGRGNDWILVVDDSSKGYPAPGTTRVRGAGL